MKVKKIIQRSEKPMRTGKYHTDLGWSVSHLFSKFVPLRQLFDNHYTVGTEISILYQTKH